MFMDMDYLAACDDAACWIPFLAGLATGLLGAGFQVYMKRRRDKRKVGAVEGDVELQPVPTSPTASSSNPFQSPSHSTSSPSSPDHLMIELSSRLESRQPAAPYVKKSVYG
jgi:hypothetical protein